MRPRKPQTALAKAIEAATEFKHFLDVQPHDGKLFNPCGRGDPRSSVTYAHAAALLAAAVLENDQRTSSTGGEIRPVWSTPVVVAPSDRAALSTLSRPASTTAPIAPAKDGTASQLREAILRCATEAQQEEQTDTDARLHCFVAKLSGCMECLGEVDMDHALWDLMQLRTQPIRALESAVIARAAATES